MTVFDVARRFLAAVYEGDANLLWELLSREAREFVVTRGMRRGLDANLGKALLDGSADEIERTEFLGDLLKGLQQDLQTVDLSRVSVGTPEAVDADRTSVVFYEAFNVESGPGLDPLPVGTLEMERIEGHWRVSRLVPRPPKAK